MVPSFWKKKRKKERKKKKKKKKNRLGCNFMLKVKVVFENNVA